MRAAADPELDIQTAADSLAVLIGRSADLGRQDGIETAISFARLLLARQGSPEHRALVNYYLANASLQNAGCTRPTNLRADVLTAGLLIDGLYGIEGPGWMFPDITARLSDPRRRADLLRIARTLESEPWTLSMSAHLLVVAHKS
jgi:hypothetical protein